MSDGGISRFEACIWLFFPMALQWIPLRRMMKFQFVKARGRGGLNPFFSLLIYDYHSKELCTPFYGNEKFAFVFVWQHIQNHDSFIIQCNILRLTANYGKLRKKVFFLLLLQFFEQLNEFLTCYTYKLSKKRNGGEILNFWFFGRWGVKTPFFGQIRIQPYPI